MQNYPATPEEVVADEFDRLRGRTLGLIESWGLPEKQERGCKSLVKALSYDAQKRVARLVEQVGEGRAADLD